MYGPFGNLFPYSDQHALNLDWIIQVAKDFLDQYTHIQEIISDGETSLDQHTTDGLAALAAEKDRLEGLLDAWYTTHSEDIADQLTAAVASFGTQAAAIGDEVIGTIPADYTALSAQVTTNSEDLQYYPGAVGAATGVLPYMFEKGYYYTTPAVGEVSVKTDSENFACAYFPVSPGDVITINADGYTSSYRAWVFMDSDGKVLSRTSNTMTTGKSVITAPENAVACAVNNRLATRPSGYYAYKGTSIPDLFAQKDNYPVQNSNNPVKSNGLFENIKELRDALGQNETFIYSHPDDGYYWNSETATAVKTAYETYRAYDAITVTPGDRMHLTCSLSGNSNKQLPFVFADDSNTIILMLGTRNAAQDILTYVPAGATKLLMTCGSNHVCRAYKITVKAVPYNLFKGTFEYEGKNVAIIGDSISTNGNYSAANPLGNVPEIVIQEEDIGVELAAYVTYYDVGTTIGDHTITEEEVGTELTFTPVEGDQGKMVGKPKNNNISTMNVWWEVAAEVLKFNPIPVCWSGSSITDHEENKTSDGHYIYKCAHSFHPSQIRKCGIRTPGSMTRTAPDMIIICRGTNDLSHSPYSIITDDLDSWPTTYPDADTYLDGDTTMYSFVKGMRLLIKTLRTAYPETKIVLCTMNYFRRLSTTAIYTSNGTDNWLKYNAMIRRIADYECCELIEFDKDGLDYWNAADGYYTEGSSSTAHWTHPNTQGQARLGSRALIDLRKVNDMTVPENG